ncbi:MAG TPA: hypothetical protein VKR31_14400, partial [Rhizomicrobium sp.]|nr:hypothetical protein [Rhizomicrobium sp.]
MRSFAGVVLAALIVLPALSRADPAADVSSTGMNMPAADGGEMVMTMTLPPVPPMRERKGDKPGAPLFDGYGDHHHPISTSDPKTQAYFDQGVRMLFAFNH